MKLKIKSTCMTIRRNTGPNEFKRRDWEIYFQK